MCLTENRRTLPPLSRNLKDFPRSTRVLERSYLLRWIFHVQWKIAFQSVIPERSVGLSVSGAVAPSAPAHRIMRELVSFAGVFDLT
jgi:hypothetical protein